MSKQVYIYGLYDPNTRELRYIGKTNNLRKRLWYHIHNAERGQRTIKDSWIRSLLNCNEKPIIGVIEETTEEFWQNDEQRCIAQAKAEGVILTNRDGLVGYIPDGLVGYIPSGETRKRLNEYNKSISRLPPNWKGRKQSPEHIVKRVEARKKNNTYKHSQETKDLISQKNTGKNLGNTHTLGMKHTEEWKEAQSKRSKGENNAFFGRQHSEETKRKISETKRKQHLAKKSRGD